MKTQEREAKKRSYVEITHSGQHWEDQTLEGQPKPKRATQADER